MLYVRAGAVKSRCGLVVEHANETQLLRQVFEQFRESVRDANAPELICVVRPHQFVIMDLAERAHSNLRFVVEDGLFYGAIIFTLSQMTTGAKQSLHWIIQSRKWGTKDVALFNRLYLTIKFAERAVSIEFLGAYIRGDDCQGGPLCGSTLV